jgi:hypothetical protein
VDDDAPSADSALDEWVSSPPPGPFGPYDGQPYGEPQYVPQPYPPGPPPAPYGYPPRYGYPAAGPWPPPYAYPVRESELRSEPVIGWFLLASGTLTIVAATMPWATAFAITVSGTSGDGKLTMAGGLILAGLGLLMGVGEGRLWVPIAGVITSLLVVLVSLIDAANISRILSRYGDAGSVGAGLWLTVFAGALSFLLSLFGLARRQSPPVR